MTYCPPHRLSVVTGCKGPKIYYVDLPLKEQV